MAALHYQAADSACTLNIMPLDVPCMPDPALGLLITFAIGQISLEFGLCIRPALSGPSAGSKLWRLLHHRRCRAAKTKTSEPSWSLFQIPPMVGSWLMTLLCSSSQLLMLALTSMEVRALDLAPWDPDPLCLSLKWAMAWWCLLLAWYYVLFLPLAQRSRQSEIRCWSL